MDNEHLITEIPRDDAQMFDAKAAAYYIKWAYSFMERYVPQKWEKQPSKLNTKVIHGLKVLNGELADIIKLTPEEQPAALAEFSYQNRAEIPQYLGSALMLARAVATDDDAAFLQGTGKPSTHDIAEKELTKENFTKLGNGLAATLNYLGEQHARSPKSQSTVKVNFYKGMGGIVSETMYYMTRTISTKLYAPQNPSFSSTHWASDLEEQGFPALSRAKKEIIANYVGGYSRGKAIARNEQQGQSWVERTVDNKGLAQGPTPV